MYDTFKKNRRFYLNSVCNLRPKKWQKQMQYITSNS